MVLKYCNTAVSFNTIINYYDQFQFKMNWYLNSNPQLTGINYSVQMGGCDTLFEGIRV